VGFAAGMLLAETDCATLVLSRHLYCCMAADLVVSDFFQPFPRRYSPHGDHPDTCILLMARLAVYHICHSGHSYCTAVSSDIERLDPNT